MKEETMYTSVWIALFVTIAIIAICCTYFNLRHDEEMAKLGYEETTIRGVNGTAWVKCNKDSLVRE